MKGYFLSFEGGDGAGKSTLMQGVYAKLLQEGVRVTKTRAPGGTSLGTKIRELLLHGDIELVGRAELFLFLADRAQHVKECILPALERGEVVLCDRFNDSTVAYQGVARGMDTEFVRSLCLFATEGLEPDRTFYLDIDPEEGLKRVCRTGATHDRIESEGCSFQQRIREAFISMSQKEPLRIQTLDAMKSPSQLVEEVIAEVHVLLHSHR